MHLFRHLLQILFLGTIFFLMLKIRLFEIPYIHFILTGLILLLIGIWGCFWGRRYFCQSAASPVVEKRASRNFLRKKHLIYVLLGGTLLWSNSLWADSFCQLAERYDQQTFNAKAQNWEGDQPCDEDDWDRARQATNGLKKTTDGFTKKDKLTAAEQKTWRSFRQDSHWNEWKQNFSEAGINAEEMACASYFATLCSAYERRHPSTVAKTVGQIMRKDANDSGCWPCKMAYITLTVVQSMSSHLETNMREAGINILKIFMLLWILYAAFLAVIFPSKGASFLKDLMTRVLCMMIAALILSSGDNLKTLYGSFLSPIVSLGLGLSQDISDHLDESMFSFADDVRSGVGIASRGPDYCTLSFSSSSGTENSPARRLMGAVIPGMDQNYSRLTNSSDSLITLELQVNLLCLTQKLYRQVSPMTAVGQSLIGFSFRQGTSILWLMKFPDLEMWGVGLVLVVLFSIFSFLVAFKIIDIFLRFGFVLVLIPLFVATWAFPITRDFTKKGFSFLMGIISDFLGLVLALNFIMISFETGLGNTDRLVAAITANYSEDYGENLLNVILSNGGWYFFFMIVALFFIGLSILSVCTQTVASFFGTSGIGGDITGLATMAAIKGTANKVWKPASNVAQKVKPYKVPNGKSGAYLAGRAYGRMKSGQNPLKDLGESNSPAASKRYFGQKAGNAVNRTSQYLASGVDKFGVGLGQALSKTGVGAILGVPLTLGAKTLSTGIRATGKVASGLVKTPGAITRGIKNTPQNLRKAGQAIKNAPKNLKTAVKNKSQAAWNKMKAPVAKGFSDGKK